MNESLLSAVLRGEPVTRRRALLQVATLLGGSASALALGGLLTACGDGEKQGDAGAGVSFSSDQRAMIASIVDLVIPGSDTPGAREVGVPEFVEIVWREGLSPADRKSFLAGLGEVDERARRAHGRSYLRCTPEQQRALISDLDAETFRPAPPPARRGGDLREFVEPGAGDSPLSPELQADTVRWRWGETRSAGPDAPFWRTLKRLTLVGYYTSEIGATKELRYQAVPGRFDGCTTLASVGRAWAV
jgi:hypothetical protein